MVEDKAKKMVTIIVNATPHEWPKNGEISYKEVVQLAYPGEAVNESSTFKVSYMKKNGDGLTSLVYGSKPIKIKEGMVFNATSANRA